MLALSSWFLITIIYLLLYSSIFSKLFCERKFELSKENIFFSVVASIINSIMIKYDIGYIRPLILHSLIFLVLKYIYKQSISKTIVGVAFIYITMCISEIIFSILIILILKIDANFLKNHFLGIIFTNLFIFLNSYFIFKRPKIKKIIEDIILWQYKKENIIMILTILFFSLIITFFLFQNFSNLTNNSYVILNNVFFASVIVFLIIYYKEKNRNNKLLNDYDQLLEYSKIYEKEVIEKSKQQHEYKNQLIIVKSMIESRNKKAKIYIDELLNETTTNPDFKLFEKLSYILSSGLKGLIYYKLKIMKNKNIIFFVDVSKQLNNKKIWIICEKNLKDVSRCLGVFIDNAIEASSLSDEKHILIEIILENNNIEFIISNSFKGNLDIAKFEKEGFSTKGKNRGYGLSLAKEIISNNTNLTQEKEINGKYYVQKLMIKIK
ncbi:MAG: GHKL domain-containing protein [Bacilli bacterium]|nr:GHKL domain-containing protein [Bacilli bacterium]